MSIHPALTFNAMRAAQSDYALTPAQFAVYMAIALAADGTTGKTPIISYTELARRANVSRSYACACAKKLKDKQLLIWTGTASGNIYGLILGVSLSSTLPSTGSLLSDTPSLLSDTPLPSGVSLSRHNQDLYQDLYQDTDARVREDRLPVVEPAAPETSVHPSVFQTYEKQIGELTQHIGARLNEMAGIYGSAWLIEALRVTKQRGQNNLRYTEGILRSWTKRGKDTPDVKLSRAQAAETTADTGGIRTLTDEERTEALRLLRTLKAERQSQQKAAV